MKTVHVLRGINRPEDTPLGVVSHPGRQRGLHEDAVHARVGVEGVDDGQRLVERGRVGQPLQRGAHPERLALPDLVADVHLRSRIGARQQQPQRGRTSRGAAHVLDARPQRLPDRGGDGRAVEHARRRPDGAHAILATMAGMGMSFRVYRGFGTMRAATAAGRHDERHAAR